VIEYADFDSKCSKKRFGGRVPSGPPDLLTGLRGAASWQRREIMEEK